ncbi:hypothetical protein [Emticicia sp. BO119]|uniref:hypothetical protein n=1 Tax=Emticicia sp. BO119 TaxID=2757768 RepID=UPI0015F084C3|nr:hypothetical protein [Emticicia sp. BO119]MBA4850746.1 hypothetical protein [Emticicia sp. BO119]
MKTLFLLFICCCFSSVISAQEASIIILPETGIDSYKKNYQPSHKISVKTQAECYGFLQKTDPIEVGTFISETNGGVASFSTPGLHNLSFTTNAQSPQLTLNILNFAGIGGTPFRALHVYGGLKISGAKNVSNYTEKSFLKVDNDGKLNSVSQTYYYSLPRSAFMPTTSSDNNPIAESNEGGIYFTNADISRGYFEVPINLPQGAIISGAEFYFVDNSNSDILFTLISTDLGSKYDVTFLSVWSTGAVSGIRSISSNNLNNGFGVSIQNGDTYQLKIYAQEIGGIKAWDGANTQIIAAKLIYTY